MQLINDVWIAIPV